MIVRAATPADLTACLAVDASYRTNQVWQMRVQRGDVLADGEEGIFVSFCPVRLPRQVLLTPPGLAERLSAGWQRRALTLVLEEEQAIYGYLGLEVRADERLGWIDVLAVDPSKRQQGWEARLVQEAIAWARGHGLRAVVLETQARNAPMIALAQQLGFAFSGYHEQYYAEAEVALFFTFPLR